MKNPFRSQNTKDKEDDLKGGTIQDFCYWHFQLGSRPGEVSNEHPWLNKRTVIRYFTKWKSTPGQLPTPSGRRRFLVQIKKRMHDKPFRAKVVAQVSRQNQLKPEEVDEILKRPNAIRGIPGGETKKKFAALRDLKTLDLAINIMDRCKTRGIDPGLVLDKAFEWVSEFGDSSNQIQKYAEKKMTEDGFTFFAPYHLKQAYRARRMDFDAILEIRKSAMDNSDQTENPPEPDAAKTSDVQISSLLTP